tara:strand:+ start:498 stop:719 length:222 start_codon:yes stop_codon:yes gene_type:complete
MGVSYGAARALAVEIATSAHAMEIIITNRSRNDEWEIPDLAEQYEDTLGHLRSAVNQIGELMRDAFPNPTGDE